MEAMTHLARRGAAAGVNVVLPSASERIWHNFSITDQSIDQDVSADKTVDVTVTFPQSGFVEFFCKYHKTSGMVGELTTS